MPHIVLKRPGNDIRILRMAALRLMWTAWCILCVFCAPASAQRIDSFEGGEPRWMLVESDCGAQLTQHEISLVMPHSGRTCEIAELDCGTGTLALLAYPIEPCAVLDEFQPSVWLRCSSGRIQLGTRVIFPNAEHPITNGRLHTILWGDIYRETGQWQMLNVHGLQKLLRAETISLRQRFGSDLNLENAYIDSLVVNAYTGPGRYRLQLDDLNLRGLIPLTATGRPLPTNWRENWRWRQDADRSARDRRFWATPNHPPTWLYYRDEPLAWVRSLGFTGLVLGQLPSSTQLAQINESQLAVICPAPAQDLVLDTTHASAIKGWLVGAALDSQQAPLARQQAQRVAQLPENLQRPLVGEALEQFWMFSRIADELILPAPASIAAGSTSDKLGWLSEKLTTTRKRGNGWVSINVGPNPAIVEQIRHAHQAISPQHPVEDILVDPTGLRQQAANAVVAGARGILFRTFKPLDISTQADSAMVAAIRWVNRELAMWGPWIMVGQPAGPVDLSREDYTAQTWNVSQSQLVLATNSAAHSSYVVPATRDRPLKIDATSSLNTQQVIRLTDGRLERMQVEVTPTGVRWQVVEPGPIEAFVITGNPSVIDFLRRQLSSGADEMAADQLEVVTYNMSIASRLVAARFPDPDPTDEGSPGMPQLRLLSLAQRQIDQGHQALRSRQPVAAMGLAHRANDMLQSLLADAQQVATSNLASPQSSPFVVTPSALGLHWQLAAACDRSQWRDLPLPGAQLVDLPEMLSAGWSQQRRLEEEMELRVELLRPTTNSAAGLRLAAYPKPEHAKQNSLPISGGYEGAALRVRSSPAVVQPGQLVRVSARARVLRATESPDSGLLVYDNQAGPSLGQLVRGAAGDVVPIELYRFVTHDGEFRLLAECRGECDIVLDSISASVIEPATNRRSYVTSPAMPPIPGAIITRQ